uniref:Uncharacterized protein n=1 Tax=Rhizophora mucronata TaxID=61149 RepID=A0A2P2N8I5_RHIMU
MQQKFNYFSKSNISFYLFGTKKKQSGFMNFKIEMPFNAFIDFIINGLEIQ